MNLCRQCVKLLVSLPIIVLALTVLSPAQDHKLPANDATTKTTMRKLYELDQSHVHDVDRSKYRKQVRQLMRDGKIRSAKDYYYAAFIFQHGQTPSDYLYAHVLAVTAVNKGLHNAIWLSAATLDRYLQSIGQPQIFGTQFGGSLTNPRDDYDRLMLSDAMRAMWCVASEATEAKILADEKAGKGFRSTRTCPLPDAQFDPGNELAPEAFPER